MQAIASKLVKIMGACSYVQKDGENKFHKYNYASAANVLEKVNAACVENNVASVVSTKIIGEKEKTTNKGGTEYLVTVEVTLTLIDGDSGESLTAVSLGTGQDPGDKAVAKAQTMALKYAWMTTLNISTGDDPEADESVDERNHKVNGKPSQGAPEGQQQGGNGKQDTEEAASREEGRKAFYAAIGDIAKKEQVDKKVFEELAKQVVYSWCKVDSLTKVSTEQWMQVAGQMEKLQKICIKQIQKQAS